MSAHFLQIAIFFVFLLVPNATTAQWVYEQDEFYFSWDLPNDKATLTTGPETERAFVWSGSLLPAFWLKPQDSAPVFLKATIDTAGSTITPHKLELQLDIPPLGSGKMIVDVIPQGLKISTINITWKEEIPAIIEMYFGTSPLNTEQLAYTLDPEKPFAPDWSAFGFCVPGAKEGPAQSYFRNWDLGQANIALGSFGPTLGAPYGAAFPRPTLMAAMGYDTGWITFGAGSIPAAPMTLQVRSGHGCLQFLYREDLWGIPNSKSRNWNDLLKITFGKNAWQSMQQYVASIPNDRILSNKHHLAVWNTWGNWKMQNYSISPITQIAQKVGAEILVLDDPWESSQGSGTHHLERFPNFYQEIENIHNSGLHHGIWETLAWVAEPDSLGLSKDDLILDRNGNPCKGSWNFDPFWINYYLLDISSERAKTFLRKRTIKVMKEVKPRLIKLDFGYGISSPNIGVPRNPAIRGERYCYELSKIIVEAAKSVDPDVTIMYYGISPLFLPLFDMVSLDDQGDLWYEHAAGHDQWSIWASLISQHNIALNGSSGYDWNSDDEILLNTAILGSPGSVLPDNIDGKDIPKAFLNRRFALHRWYRKSIQWTPLWLNSELGGMQRPMQLRCWGRMEKIDAEDKVTALVLREPPSDNIDYLASFSWQGRWALIAQDNQDISSSKELAIIPFDEETFLRFPVKMQPTQVLQIAFDSEKVYSKWRWHKGVLELHLEPGDLAQTAGFIVKTPDK